MNLVFKDAGAVVVAHYAGLSVAQMTAFRAKMRDAGASVKVAKNRLAKLALQGTDAETIADLLKGPTVIAYSKDPVAAPKVATDFAKTNDKFVILGGSLGRTSLNPEGIKALSSLVAAGKIKYRESVVEGIENAPQGLIDLLQGKNFGKQLVKIA